MPSKCGGIKTLKLKLKRKRKRKSTGKKKSQKGGAYGNTMNSLSNNAQGGMGYSYPSATPYNHCGGQKGGSVSAIFNNRGGYGYTNGGAGMAGEVIGGYAPISPYVNAQCGAGRKVKKSRKTRKTKKGMRKSKHNKSRKNKTHKMKKKHGRKCRCKGKCVCRRTKHHKKSRKHKTKTKGKKHYQKGGSGIASLGYSQFQSNTPMGASYEMPGAHTPLPAVAPNSFNKTNVNCPDNYNHYKK